MPHLDVALHHDVEHALVFVGELVLLEPAEPQARLQHHLAGALLQLTAEDFHEGGFAGAVRPDQAIAVAVGEFHRHLLEQRFGAELDGDVRSGKHGRRVRRGPRILHYRAGSMGRVCSKSRFRGGSQVRRSTPALDLPCEGTGFAVTGVLSSTILNWRSST